MAMMASITECTNGPQPHHARCVYIHQPSAHHLGRGLQFLWLAPPRPPDVRDAIRPRPMGDGAGSPTPACPVQCGSLPSPIRPAQVGLCGSAEGETFMRIPAIAREYQQTGA